MLRPGLDRGRSSERELDRICGRIYIEISHEKYLDVPTLVFFYLPIMMIPYFNRDGWLV